MGRKTRTVFANTYVCRDESLVFEIHRCRSLVGHGKWLTRYPPRLIAAPVTSTGISAKTILKNSRRISSRTRRLSSCCESKVYLSPPNTANTVVLLIWVRMEHTERQPYRSIMFDSNRSRSECCWGHELHRKREQGSRGEGSSFMCVGMCAWYHQYRPPCRSAASSRRSVCLCTGAVDFDDYGSSGG